MLAAIASHSRAPHRTPVARAARAGNCTHGATTPRGRRAQGFRHGLFEHGSEGVRHPGAQHALTLDAAREPGIALEGRGNLGAPRGVEFAVDVGHQGFIVIVHGGSPSAAASAVRPRASRLVNVPIGISSTSAASLYDIPSTRTSATARRCSSGSLCMASEIAQRLAFDIIRRDGRMFAAVLGQRDFATPCVRAPIVDPRVFHDAEHPGGEIRAGLELLEIAPGALDG